MIKRREPPWRNSTKRDSRAKPRNPLQLQLQYRPDLKTWLRSPAFNRKPNNSILYTMHLTLHSIIFLVHGKTNGWLRGRHYPGNVAFKKNFYLNTSSKLFCGNSMGKCFENAKIPWSYSWQDLKGSVFGRGELIVPSKILKIEHRSGRW